MKRFSAAKSTGGFAVFCLAAIAVPMSLVGVAAASAEDIPVVATVLEPSPTATPKTFVDLPVGESSQSAPEVLIQLTGLEPYSFVQIFAQSEPVLIASGFADKYGVFKVTAQLPPALEPGSHSIVANAQLLGEAAPSTVTLTKFAVSASGSIQKSASGGSSSSGTGGGSNGGGTGGGSNGGGTDGGGSGQPTPSPSASNQAEADLSRGVVQVSGYTVQSALSANPFGEPAHVQLTLENNSTENIDLEVYSQVSNFLGIPVAQAKDIKGLKLASGAIETINLETSGIGQWGFYSSRVTVSPKGKIGGVTLQSLVREASFFVLPIWPVTLLLIAIVAEIIRSVRRNILLKRKYLSISSASELRNESGE